MANFSELLADVYTITNRPDLIAETKLAVKQATLKMHQSDFYPKDVFETGIQWDPVALIQSLDYKTLIPRYRAFKYLRKITDNVPGVFFEMLSPEHSLDRYQINKENICYLAGEHIEIRSNTEDSNMLIGCYLHPDITELTFNSWIAAEHPYSIVFDAASQVFKTIGFDSQAAAMRQNVTEQIALIRQNQLTGIGY